MTVQGLEVKASSDAQRFYVINIEEGVEYLEAMTDLDEDYTAKLQRLKELEQDTDKRMNVFDREIASLRQQLNNEVSLRQLFKDDLERMTQGVRRGQLVIYNYALDRKGRAILDDDKLRLETSPRKGALSGFLKGQTRFRSPSGSEGVFRAGVLTVTFGNAQARKEAQATLRRVHKDLHSTWIKESTKEIADLNRQLSGELPGTAAHSRQQLLMDLEQLRQDVEEVDLGVSENKIRNGRYWFDFVELLRSGSDSPYFKPLTNVGKGLFRYRRARMRIIFRRFPSRPRYFHILSITFRSDETYSDRVLGPLIAASDRQWAQDGGRRSSWTSYL